MTQALIIVLNIALISILCYIFKRLISAAIVDALNEFYKHENLN